MASLISVHELGHSFGAKPLFQKLTFGVEEGERIGLIGPNGVGKSTLLRILAGQMAPDRGTVAARRGLGVGYLEQVPEFTEGLTVRGALAENLRPEKLDGVDEWASRAGFDDLEKPVDELSGGWRKRVALVRELLKEPDLLLLDEPTNHLDVEGIEWVEGMLARARFASVTITHDRAFLGKVANRIVEIDPRYVEGMLSVAGGYALYLETRASVLEAQAGREEALRNRMRRETEWLRQGAKARTTKQQARIGRAEALIEEVRGLGERNRVNSATLEFDAGGRSTRKLIEAIGIAKGYDRGPLFSGLDLKLGPGARLGLIGPNGAGKSTLLRVLLKQEAPDAGEVKHAPDLKIAVFEQGRESLDPNLTLARTVCPLGDSVVFRDRSTHVRSYLGRFLFRPDQTEVEVGKLSGGEQARLLLARLMLRPADVLVLDEPTNDLDFQTLDLLEESLTEFPGAVILVSHDRYFLDQVSTQMLGFAAADPGSGRGARVTKLASLVQWEEWRAELKREAAASGGGRNRGSASGATSAPAAAKPAAPTKPLGKLSFKETHELAGMEAAIAATEADAARFEAECANPATLGSPAKLREATEGLAAAHKRIEVLYTRWAELDAKSQGTGKR